MATSVLALSTSALVRACGPPVGSVDEMTSPFSSTARRKKRCRRTRDPVQALQTSSTAITVQLPGPAGRGRRCHDVPRSVGSYAQGR